LIVFGFIFQNFAPFLVFIKIALLLLQCYCIIFYSFLLDRHQQVFIKFILLGLYC